MDKSSYKFDGGSVDWTRNSWFRTTMPDDCPGIEAMLFTYNLETADWSISYRRYTDATEFKSGSWLVEGSAATTVVKTCKMDNRNMFPDELNKVWTWGLHVFKGDWHTVRMVQLVIPHKVGLALSASDYGPDIWLSRVPSAVDDFKPYADESATTMYVGAKWRENLTSLGIPAVLEAASNYQVAAEQSKREHMKDTHTQLESEKEASSPGASIVPVPQEPPQLDRGTKVLPDA